MKKQTLFTGLLLFFSITTAFSQNFSFGVRGGLNVAKLSIELPSNLWPQGNKVEARTNFNLGAFGQYSVNEKITLHTELFYSGEGASFTDPGTEHPADVTYSYLALPVFFKYTIVEGFYAMVGPQISYLLKAESVYENGGEYDILNAHNRINIALVPAIGYGWKDFSVNVRYQAGLSKLPKADASWSMTPYADENVKSNVFSVVIAYKIIK